MRISILAGIIADLGADFRTSYPLNLIPVPKQTGINEGYLRTAEGMVTFSATNNVPDNPAGPIKQPVDRGAITWNDVCYRVIGAYLVRINADGTDTVLGSVGFDGEPVSMDYGFDYLSIGSAGDLYYYRTTTGLQQVTDTDLGTVVDHIWISGYYMTTDGDYLVTTELNDPFSVNPTKYGSSEAAPDKIKRLRRIRNEAVALNRYTTEFFQNVGGSGFPFQRVEGAMIPKGCVGTFASCYYLETFAFVGGGTDEATSVYVGAPGQAVKIATREIEIILADYTPEQQGTIVLESRAEKLHEFLYLHLPDRTMVYDAAASKALGEAVWFELSSVDDSGVDTRYSARYFTYCYGKWLFGDILRSRIVGYLTDRDARQYGNEVPWQFDTPLLYNESRAAIIHELELVRLPGRPAAISPPPERPATIWLSYTDDGISWSTPRPSGSTKPGMTLARTIWRKLGRMQHYRGLRVRGMYNPYPDALVRLEAVIEPLRY